MNIFITVSQFTQMEAKFKSGALGILALGTTPNYTDNTLIIYIMYWRQGALIVFPLCISKVLNTEICRNTF